MNQKPCMNCGSTGLVEFIDLGLQPNGNNFPFPAEAAGQRKFPLAMNACTNCWQVQIAEFPSPEFLFTDHPYITGLNVPIVEHFSRLAHHIIEKFALTPGELVIDIGCNDGTFLKAFEKEGMCILGIDPGRRTGQLARKKGVTVCESFWNRASGAALKSLNLRPRVITATAVFYHIPDLHDFVRGLVEAMSEETIFVVQCVYLKDLLEKNQFDHFYHEHSCIHAVGPLVRLFEAHGLRAFDVEFIDVHGGSFVLYACTKDGLFDTRSTIEGALEQERRAGLHDIQTYKQFTDRVRRKASALREILLQARRDGKRVFGLGAPVKGSTLLNFCGIGPDLVELIVEVNQFKIGRVTPGNEIPIVDEATISQVPDFYLLLSWNFLDFMIEKYRKFLLSGGKFIVPEPDVRILGAEALGAKSL